VAVPLTVTVAVLCCVTVAGAAWMVRVVVQAAQPSAIGTTAPAATTFWLIFMEPSPRDVSHA
jgi:hypothetical protein